MKSFKDILNEAPKVPTNNPKLMKSGKKAIDDLFDNLQTMIMIAKHDKLASSSITDHWQQDLATLDVDYQKIIGRLVEIEKRIGKAFRK